MYLEVQLLIYIRKKNAVSCSVDQSKQGVSDISLNASVK